MDNWLADEMLVYEQLREARAKAARSRSLAAVERRRRPGVMRAWLAAALISLGERLAQPQERRVWWTDLGYEPVPNQDWSQGATNNAS